MRRHIRTPSTPDEWIIFNKNLLRAHMTLTNTTYPALSAALLRIGVDEDARNLRGRVAHGHFSAVFFLQCMRAMNVDTLHLPVDDLPVRPKVAPRRRRPDLTREAIAKRKAKEGGPNAK